MTKPKIHTMNELSKVIGISRPTLARFFENESSVMPSTSQKIKERLESVDYVYNFLATRQNRKSTGLIGVIVPRFDDPFYASLLDSIEAAARGAGFTMITKSSKGGQKFEEKAVQDLRSMNVDGAIIAPFEAEGNHETFEAAANDFPIVFADSHPTRTVPHTDFVGTNNANSIGVMVEYLCRSGAAPLYLTVPKLNSSIAERRDAYFAKMHELGYAGEVIPAPDGMPSREFERFGFEVMDTHFGQGRFVDSTILCVTDRMAYGVVRAANTYGLFARRGGVKGELRVAGHDDHPLSRYMHPALTTVAQQVNNIGKEAVSLLSDRVRNGRAGGAVTRLLDGALKVRESA